MASGKIFKTVALLMVLVITQVYALGNTAMTTLSGDAGRTNEGRSGLLSGRLELNQDQAILVNGNSAISGATILTGAQISTPAEFGATVQIGSLGRLSVAPGTTLTLSFDKESVNVAVANGNAYLTTGEGVKGNVSTTDKADASKTSSASPQGGGAGNAGRPTFGRTFGVGLVIVGGLILAAVFLPCRRPNNPSAVTSSGNNNCRRGF